MRLFVNTNSSTKANEPVHTSTGNISKWSDAFGARQDFHLQQKFYISRGFRCSPSATDKHNMAVNACQNYSSGTKFTYSCYSKNGMRICLLTSCNSKSQDSVIHLLLTISSSINAGNKLSFDNNTRKQSNQSTRRQRGGGGLALCANLGADFKCL